MLGRLTRITGSGRPLRPLAASVILLAAGLALQSAWEPEGVAAHDGDVFGPASVSGPPDGHEGAEGREGQKG